MLPRYRQRFSTNVACRGGGAVGSTWNPLDKAADVVLSNGNRAMANSVNNHKMARSTTSKTSGIWYAEVTRSRPTTDTSDVIGVANSSETLTTFVGSGNSIGVTWDGRVLYNSSDIVNFDDGGGPDGTVGVGAFGTGTITIGIELNVGARTIKFYKTGGAVSSTFNLNHPVSSILNTGALFLASSASFSSGNTDDDNGLILNTGQAAWVIGLPAGATAWG